MRKIAVTIPAEQMRTLERIRRREGIPRSRVVQRALEWYFAQSGLAEDVRAYEEGYRRRPERVADAQGYMAAAAEVLETEDWV